MLSWSGLGFLVVVTWAGPMLPVWAFTDRSLLWPSLVGQGVAAVTTYAAGRRLNRAEVKHYFCGIRFESWGWIMPLLCAVIYGLHLGLS